MNKNDKKIKNDKNENYRKYIKRFLNINKNTTVLVLFFLSPFKLSNKSE